MELLSKYRRQLAFLAGLAVIALVAFAFFYPDAPQGNVLRQHDMQQGIAIGQEAKAYAEATGHTPRWTNSLFSGMPTFQISPSYPSSRLITWINTVMGLGLPSPAQLPAMMMTGFFILLLCMGLRWYVALIGAVAYGFSSYFIIIIGAGHIWKFVTLAYIPPTIAGVVLCYRGRLLTGTTVAALFAMMQIASNHVQMTYYFLFVVLAFVLAYLWQAIKGKTLAKWGVATACLFGAAMLAVAANLPSLYFTYEYAKETMRGNHSELTSATPADASQATSGLDKDYITQYSYLPSETFSLLIPNIKGGANIRPAKGSFERLSLATLPAAVEKGQKGELDPAAKQYLENVSQYFGDPEGTNGPVYVGALICALFLVGCFIVRGPLKWALLGMTVFSILLAWGRHAMIFTDFMLGVVPMYSKFRTVESILVIAEFTMPVLASLALARILAARESADGFEKIRKPLYWCFGAVLFFCALGFCVPGIYGSAVTDTDRQIDAMIASQLESAGYGSDVIQMFSLANPAIYSAVEELRHGLLAADALRSFIVAGLGFALIFFYLKGRMAMPVAVAALAVVVLADLYMVDKRYISHDSFVPKQITVGPPIAKTPVDDAILADTASHYRVMDMPRFYMADPSYYHKTIGGYHAAKLTRYQDLIDRHLSHFSQGCETDADWNVLNMLNAKYIVSLDGYPMQNPEAYGNAWFVGKVDYVDTPDREMDALSYIRPDSVAVADVRFRDILGPGSPVTPGDTIRLTSYAPDRLTYSTTTAQGGVAVFSEVYFPWGWKATVDGRPAELARVDYVLRAMRIPAGHHEVVMTFDPPSLRATDGTATASIIVIYLLCAVAIVAGGRRLCSRP